MNQIETSKYIDLLNMKKFDEAEVFRTSLIPKKLYKYVSLNNTNCDKLGSICYFDENNNHNKLSSIKNNKLWLSTVRGLNDPFEMKAMLLNREKISENHWPEDIFDKFISHLHDTYLIGSFTSNVTDNMPMWAHYANNHKGYCLEYEVLNPKLVYPIAYEEKRVPIATIIHNVMALISLRARQDNFDKEEDLQFYTMLVRHLSLIKHKTWEYENEYRICFPHDKKVNFGDLIDLSTLGIRLSGVFLGKEMDMQIRKEIIGICSNNKLKVFEMFLDDNNLNFELEAKEITIE